MNAPGRNFIKVTGILWIIFGAIGLLTGLFIADLASAGGKVNIPGMEQLTGSIGLLAFLMIIGSIVEIIIGIFGIYHCNNREKANLILTIATCYIIYLILLIILYKAVFSFFSMTSLISFLFPILYIVGAKKNAE